jgi:hypothetical protein
MWSERDLEIRRKTFARLKAQGIGTPLVGYKFDPPPTLPPEEQEAIRKMQKEHREHLAKTNPKRWLKKPKGKYAGLGRKQSAFARALEARGFDTRDTTRISRGKFSVEFNADGWSLSKEDEILHTQPFGAGSINIVDRLVSRNGGY